MTGHQLHLPGFKLDKSGKRVIRNPARLDVSAQLRQRAKGRVRFAAASRDWQRPPPGKDGRP